MTAMEPRGPDGRQADVTDRTSHARHEPLDIAAFAAGDLGGPDRERVGDLIGSCDACRGLLADLQALAVATRTDPPAFPPRRTDFRLTDDDAVRLSSPSRRLMAWLAGPRGSITRPLAMGLATLGVAVIVLSSIPLPFAGLGGSAASRQSEAGAPSTEGLLPGAGPTAGANMDVTGADASPPSSLGAVEPPGDLPGVEDDATKRVTVEAFPLDPLPTLGVVLVGAGLVVFALRPLARRLS